MGRRKKKSEPRSFRILSLALLGSGLVTLGLVGAIMLIASTPAKGGTLAAAPVPVVLDFPAPDLELTDLNGQQVSLADYRGQFVLVNNWATWCPPCRAEMPVLEAFYREHKDQGFALIAVEAGDPPRVVREFVERYQLSFPVWLDPENQALRGFANNTLPSSYLINPDGKVVMGWSGAVTRAALERYVVPLLESH